MSQRNLPGSFGLIHGKRLARRGCMMRIVVASCVLVACIPTSVESGDDVGADSDIDSDPDSDPTPIVASKYQVRSQIDLTVGAVLPESAYDMVTTLRNFSIHPARTLFDAAEAAGVPAV